MLIGVFLVVSTLVWREYKRDASVQSLWLGEVSENNLITLPDAVISSLIIASYGKDDLINVTAIRVQTQNGVVLIEGMVPDEEVRYRALFLASRTKGVKRVTSQLVVVPEL